MDTLQEKVLIACRTELCQLFPALNAAFACLPFRPGGSFGTDGSWLYAPDSLIALYARDPAALRRGYLHVLIHCLYLHLQVPDRVSPEDWGLACDMWAEQLIGTLNEPRLGSPDPDREAILSRIRGTPEQILRQVPELPWSREELHRAVSFDDHTLWLPKLPDALKARWEGILAGGGQLGQGSRGSLSRGGEDTPLSLDEPLYNFRKFLRRYTFPREELETDEESFDYIYYHLGMERYGNLPLMEPLEYKEVWRLDTLAIAIDTSASCSRELVSRFLQETYAILSARENFFRKMQVVFFQCDCCLQDTALITCREQWQSYADKVKILGRGGTDFRPVFRAVEALYAEGRIRKPRALLYFTDGDGIYPAKPDYETVFVLAGPGRHPELVPRWAKTLVLD